MTTNLVTRSSTPCRQSVLRKRWGCSWHWTLCALGRWLRLAWPLSPTTQPPSSWLGLCPTTQPSLPVCLPLRSLAILDLVGHWSKAAAAAAGNRSAKIFVQILWLCFCRGWWWCWHEASTAAGQLQQQRSTISHGKAEPSRGKSRRATLRIASHRIARNPFQANGLRLYRAQFISSVFHVVLSLSLSLSRL